MIKTINLTTDVPLNRQLHLLLPEDVPTGLAEFVIVIASRSTVPPKTLGDLAQSEFFGMWRERDDIQDSAEFARDLRARAWKR